MKLYLYTQKELEKVIKTLFRNIVYIRYNYKCKCLASFLSFYSLILWHLASLARTVCLCLLIICTLLILNKMISIIVLIKTETLILCVFFTVISKQEGLWRGISQKSSLFNRHEMQLHGLSLKNNASCMQSSINYQKALLFINFRRHACS